MNGRLYLIPTPLGAESDEGLAIPSGVRKIVQGLDGVIAESKKCALAFLKKMEHPRPLSSIPVRLLNEHTHAQDMPDLLDPLIRGECWGLVSDAGCPAVADPGADLVRLAHARGIKVTPLPGPASPLLALMASGLNGQRFAFHGYLSRVPDERRRQLRELESHAAKHDRAEIWMETPYRNLALFQDAMAVLKDKTLFCVAVDLTLPTEEIHTKPVAEWKTSAPPDLKNRPAIFLLA